MDINSGYVAGLVPLYPQGTNSTMFTECDSEEEKEQFIAQCIQEDFMMEISWSEISREN